jgi:hypothetical protein
MREQLFTRDERLALACVMIGMVGGAALVLMIQAFG